MLITWYTDPSKGSFSEGSTKFSSFYQYDTVSKKFVRIRLELGRTGSDGGKTFSSYKETRYVGFSNDPSIRTSQKTKWSVNDQGELVFDGTPLSQEPKPGYGVFDTSSSVFESSTFIHRGNKISAEANFPEGIEPRYLSLVANDTMINGGKIDFTNSTATAEELSEAIKSRVKTILDVEDLSTVSDETFLDKLKSQIQEIKSSTLQPSQNALEDSIDQTSRLFDQLNSEIVDKGIVPTEEFESAVQNLREKIQNASEAITSKEGIKDAITELQSAQENLKTKAQELSDNKYEEIESTISSSKEAIDSAATESQRWESINSEYNEVESSSSIEQYEESMRYEEAPIEAI